MLFQTLVNESSPTNKNQLGFSHSPNPNKKITTSQPVPKQLDSQNKLNIKHLNRSVIANASDKINTVLIKNLTDHPVTLGPSFASNYVDIPYSNNSSRSSVNADSPSKDTTARSSTIVKGVSKLSFLEAVNNKLSKISQDAARTLREVNNNSHLMDFIAYPDNHSKILDLSVGIALEPVFVNNAYSLKSYVFIYSDNNSCQLADSFLPKGDYKLEKASNSTVNDYFQDSLVYKRTFTSFSSMIREYNKSLPIVYNAADSTKFIFLYKTIKSKTKKTFEFLERCYKYFSVIQLVKLDDQGASANEISTRTLVQGDKTDQKICETPIIIREFSFRSSLNQNYTQNQTQAQIQIRNQSQPVPIPVSNTSSGLSETTRALDTKADKRSKFDNLIASIKKVQINRSKSHRKAKSIESFSFINTSAVEKRQTFHTYEHGILSIEDGCINNVIAPKYPMRSNVDEYFFDSPEQYELVSPPPSPTLSSVRISDSKHASKPDLQLNESKTNSSISGCFNLSNELKMFPLIKQKIQASNYFKADIPPNSYTLVTTNFYPIPIFSLSDMILVGVSFAQNPENPKSRQSPSMYGANELKSVLLNKFDLKDVNFIFDPENNSIIQLKCRSLSKMFDPPQLTRKIFTIKASYNPETQSINSYTVLQIPNVILGDCFRVHIKRDLVSKINFEGIPGTEITIKYAVEWLKQSPLIESTYQLIKKEIDEVAINLSDSLNNFVKGNSKSLDCEFPPLLPARNYNTVSGIPATNTLQNQPKSIIKASSQNHQHKNQSWGLHLELGMGMGFPQIPAISDFYASTKSFAIESLDEVFNNVLLEEPSGFFETSLVQLHQILLSTADFVSKLTQSSPPSSKKACQNDSKTSNMFSGFSFIFATTIGIILSIAIYFILNLLALI